MIDGIKEAKRYLKQIGILDIRIKNLTDEIIKLKDKMGDAKTMSFEPRIGASGNLNTKSPQELLIERINNCEIELDNLMMDYTCKRQEIVKNILKLEDKDMIEVIYNRYVMSWGWKRIAKESGYHRSHVHRIHDKGIEELAKILKLETQ